MPKLSEFERYIKELSQALGHRDRHAPNSNATSKSLAKRWVTGTATPGLPITAEG